MHRTLDFFGKSGAGSEALPVMPYTLNQEQEKLAQALPAYCSVDELIDDLETRATRWPPIADCGLRGPLSIR